MIERYKLNISTDTIVETATDMTQIVTSKTRQEIIKLICMIIVMEILFTIMQVSSTMKWVPWFCVIAIPSIFICGICTAVETRKRKLSIVKNLTILLGSRNNKNLMWFDEPCFEKDVKDVYGSLPKWRRKYLQPLVEHMLLIVYDPKQVSVTRATSDAEYVTVTYKTPQNRTVCFSTTMTVFNGMFKNKELITKS